jgi:DNA primase
VEGPLDVLAIAARQGRRADGHLLPVAASGTAFTSRQAVSVANANALDGRPVVVAMDGDDAGRHAALRAGERLRIAGCDVRIASLPNGADPASYLTDERHDLSIFETRSAVPLLGAQVARVLADQGDHMQWAEGKVAASRIIANYLTGYPPDRAVENAGWIANALEMEPSTFAGVLGVAFREARALPPAGDRAGDLLREAADLAVPSRDLASVSPLRRTW